MNPWADASPVALVKPSCPVVETFQTIQLFEKERKDSNIASYRRNEAYWIELKKIHAESLIDLADFVEYLHCKKDSNRKQGVALSSLSKSVGKEKSGPRAASASSKTGDDAPKNNLNQGAGMQTRRTLEEFDVSMSTKFIAEADYLEKDLIRNFVAQVDSMETELKSLWLKGDRLLFAMKLSDLRAKKNFETYSSLVADQTKQKVIAPVINALEISSAQDIWLSEMSYSVAAARSYEVKDECNKQLKFLFARAKEFESRRRSSIAKAGEVVLTRQFEMWRNIPLQASIMGERVARIQSDPSNNIGKTLASRVETSHDSVAMAMMTQQQDKLREMQRARQGDSPVPAQPGYVTPTGTEGVPRLPFPLRSPSLLESAVFQKQGVSTMLSKTWSPVLLCFSSAGYLHMFDIDPKGEMGTDSSAFGNVAQQSRKGIELEIFSSLDTDKIAAPVESSSTKVVSGDIYQTLSIMLQTESFMTPTLSFCVMHCTVQFTPTANETVFEITESTANTGFGSLFRSTNERRVTLRSNSQAQMVDWILKIEKPKKEAQPSK